MATGFGRIGGNVGGGAPGNALSKGQFPNLAALQVAFPIGQDGWTAWIGPRLYQWNPVTLNWEDAIGGVLVRDDFTPTANQTAFTLSQQPTEPATVTVYVNGVAYRPTFDFTTSGLTVTWLNTFPLTPDDGVSVLYT
jgi:hypothetical protein